MFPAFEGSAAGILRACGTCRRGPLTTDQKLLLRVIDGNLTWRCCLLWPSIPASAPLPALFQPVPDLLDLGRVQYKPCRKVEQGSFRTSSALSSSDILKRKGHQRSEER